MDIRRLGLAAGLASLVATPFAWSQTPGTPADQAFMQSMQHMQQTTSAMPMTGKTDQDFVMLMVPHHQAAVSMAKTELKYGKSRYLKRMAKKIIASQDREIKEMKHWLAKHPNMK